MIHIHAIPVWGFKFNMRSTYRNRVLGISNLILVLQVTLVFASPQTTGYYLLLVTSADT